MVSFVGLVNDDVVGRFFFFAIYRKKAIQFFVQAIN
jgi:hypothetical protein